MVAVLWDSISTSFLCWVFFFFFAPLAFLSSLTQFSVITISHFARLLLLPAHFAYTQSSTSLTISIHGKVFWCLCCPIHSGTECHTSAVCCWEQLSAVSPLASSACGLPDKLFLVGFRLWLHRRAAGSTAPVYLFVLVLRIGIIFFFHLWCNFRLFTVELSGVHGCPIWVPWIFLSFSFLNCSSC